MIVSDLVAHLLTLDQSAEVKMKGPETGTSTYGISSISEVDVDGTNEVHFDINALIFKTRAWGAKTKLRTIMVHDRQIFCDQVNEFIYHSADENIDIIKMDFRTIDLVGVGVAHIAYIWHRNAPSFI